MRILGIDPGYAIVGFGALDYVRGAFCPVQYGAITTQAHTLFEQRLEEIYFDMTQLLQNLKPDAVAMEQLYFPAQPDNGHGRGAGARRAAVMCAACTRAGVRIHTHAGEAKRYRLWQGHQKAGAGNDAHAAAHAGRAKTR